jgi:oligopeptide/dipeptide ABC transporter ATP-binding protein
VRSESVGWRLADAGDVTSGQCLEPVPAMTCVAGNGRVRSSWESPRVPVPSRVVAGMADRIMVMYGGKPVETAPADTVFYVPRMPYTLGLLGSLPRLDADSSGPLRPIPGAPPSLLDLPPGCPFAPRCPLAYQRCLDEEPALSQVDPGHDAACHRSAELAGAGPELFAPGSADDGEVDGNTVSVREKEEG